jgi:hypothetical protein
MAQGKPRDPRKEQYWRRWIQQWRHSNLTVPEFCERHHLALPRFYAWRRTLEQRDHQRERSAPFLPVHVVADDAPAAAAFFELVLSGDRILRIAPGFDAATLRQLLAILGEERRC